MKVEQQYSSAWILSGLRTRIRISSQRAVAKDLGVTPQFLNDVICERRKISDRLAGALGYRRRIVFEKIK